MLKKRIYARAGISVYWIVNLVERCIEVHTQPMPDATPPDFQQRRVVRLVESIDVEIEGGTTIAIDVSEILP